MLDLGALVLGGLVVLPLLWLVWRGLSRPEEALLPVLQNNQTLRITLRSALLATLVGGLCVAVALPAAWLTHTTDMPGAKTFRWLLNLPLAVPSYVSGFVVVALAGPGGLVSLLTRALGLPPPAPWGPWTGTVLALLWSWPMALLLLQAALRRLDPHTWEAARALGSSPAQAFLRVVLPQLRPAMAGGFLLVALYVLSDFGAVSLMRFESLSYVIYVRYRGFVGREEAIGLALLLSLLALLVVLGRRWLHGQHAARSARQVGRPWPTITLGAWRWPAFLFCLGLALYGVGLPLLVLLSWLVGFDQASVDLSPLSTVARESMSVAVIAACVALVLASFLAWQRRSGHPAIARATYLLVHAGYALPGIVVALALVGFSIRATPALYQTTALLVFAYMVRFLPLALHALMEGLDAQSPRLVEAAQTLGDSPWRAWWRVVLPNLLPACAAALIAVWISVLKELPATLLLSPPGFRSLATRIWSLTEDALYSAAALPILALLALAVVGLLVQGRR